MFAGHLAVALAAKAAEPRAPLPALVAASCGIDLVWPLLLLAGLERVTIEPGATAFTPLAFEWYPWTHSLLMVLGWSGLAWGLARAFGLGRRPAAVVGLAVSSHWVLDWITHGPDLPLWPGGPEVGLGLWHSVAGTLALEGMVFMAAVALYARRAPAPDGRGRIALASLLAVVAVIWMMGPFSPPPPSSTAVAVVGLALWILPFWAWRIEARTPHWPAAKPERVAP